MKAFCKLLTVGFSALLLTAAAFGQGVSRNGLVLYYRNVDLPVKDASGQGNNAMSQGTLTASNSPSLVSMQQTGQLTYAAWINVNSIGAFFPVLLSKGGNQAPADYGGYEFTLDVSGDHDLLFVSGNFVAYTGGGLINNNLGQWIHVAFTIDTNAQTEQFFVNGQPVPTTVEVGSFSDVNFNLTNNLYVGRPDPGANPDRVNFDGQMRQVLLYNRALSAQEIQTLALDTNSLVAIKRK